jgi:hypothetical protein
MHNKVGISWSAVFTVGIGILIWVIIFAVATLAAFGGGS